MRNGRIRDFIKIRVVEPLLPCLSGIGPVRRWLTPFCYPFVILMYHRVLPKQELDTSDPNNLLCVSLERFEEQIAYLKKHHSIISINQLPERLYTPSNETSLVITFDDGYRDNLQHALPILRKYGVPVTIFVVTRYLEGDDFLWHFDLWDILRHQDSLDFKWKDARYQCTLFSGEEKIEWFKRLNLLFRSCCSLEEQKDLADRLNIEKAIFTHSSQLLNWGEVVEMSKDPLIVFGSHTHNHLSMKALPIGVARREVEMSIALLKEHLGYTVEHFSYPYGTPNEAGEPESLLMKSFGIKTAVTTNWPSLQPTLNPWLLPRFSVLDRTTQYTLHRLLSGWDGLYRRCNLSECFT